MISAENYNFPPDSSWPKILEQMETNHPEKFLLYHQKLNDFIQLHEKYEEAILQETKAERDYQIEGKTTEEIAKLQEIYTQRKLEKENAKRALKEKAIEIHKYRQELGIGLITEDTITNIALS